MINRIIIIVLDGFGVGSLPDARLYGDQGSNTLGNIAKISGGLSLPELEKMGLGNIIPVQGVEPRRFPLASFGKMSEKSAGKDSITGHWEMAGLILEKPFPLYPQGFPEEIIAVFEKETGRKVLGNIVASGTDIIEKLGEEHLKTGGPIVYTSADSVFQVAAHEKVVDVETLYRWCKTARRLLKGDYLVGRVIARPFTGSPGNFIRTAGRKDYPLKPFEKTILDLLYEQGEKVVSIGKISDIFGGSGISCSYPTKNNREGLLKVRETAEGKFKGLIFANLIDFDMLYGHRNDVEGYYKALREFDSFLPQILKVMKNDDLLIITSDHGCDPTYPGTDHTREYVPLIVYGKKCRAGISLGTRESFSDIAATAADIFKIRGIRNGTSFKTDILGDEISNEGF